MKLSWLLTGILLLASTTAFASGVEVCEKDELTMDQINAIRPTERTDLTNENGELVGAIEFSSANKKELQAIYLCGPNSGYYYAEGETSSWVGEVGSSYPIGSIYNDEYDVDATAETMTEGLELSMVKITVSVKFTGEPADADWEPFTASVYALLPVSR